MSIHRRRTKDGRLRYDVRWREGGREGRNRQAAFDTKLDAEIFETARRRAKQLGQLSTEVLGSEQLFADFVSEWWETYARVRLRPGTLTSYAYQLDRWIIPFLGEIPLRELSRAAIDRYVAELVSARAGPPTVNRCLAITQGILQRALEWGRVATNPVGGVPRLPHARNNRITAQTAGRPRERLLVRRALSDHRLSLTKSNRAREPELFTPVAEELVELSRAIGTPERRSLVFPDARGGHLRRQNWRKRTWLPALCCAHPCPACEATGRADGHPCASCEGTGTAGYFRPYDLRHTAATLLIYAGRTINEVAEHLGHADPGFTARTYTHVHREAHKHRGVPLEDVIRGARERATKAHDHEVV
jgi:integrase